MEVWLTCNTSGIYLDCCGFVLNNAAIYIRKSVLSGCHDDTTVINMHETPKVSAEGHGHPLQGARPSEDPTIKDVASYIISGCLGAPCSVVCSPLRVLKSNSYMTTETSGSLQYSSLNKHHIIKTHNVLCFIARQVNPCAIQATRNIVVKFQIRVFFFVQ